MKSETKEALKALQKAMEVATCLKQRSADKEKRMSAEYGVNAAGRYLLACFQRETFPNTGQAIDEATIVAVREALTQSVSHLSIWRKCQEVVAERLTRFEKIVSHCKKGI